MYSFVAKQPILNTMRETVAYELLFRNGLSNGFPQGISAEQATTTLISEQFLDQSINKLVGNCWCFVNFPYSLIVDKLVDFLPVDKVVIEILEDCKPDDNLLKSIKELKSKGFKIALDDFTMDDAWIRFLPYTDIIKFDFKEYPLSQIQKFIQKNQGYDIKFLAEKVETEEEYQFAIRLGFSLFQGYFFSNHKLWLIDLSPKTNSWLFNS